MVIGNVPITLRIKWKVINFFRALGLRFCDWCETLCFSPTYLDHSEEEVCRHCIDEDGQECVLCEEIVHADFIRSFDSGDYCDDCYDAQYG